MKVAVLSESQADEAAIRVLIEGLLHTQIEPPSGSPPRRRAWGKDALLTTLSGLLRGLHYHTDADGVVVVLDSDRSPVHLEAHNQPGEADPECRLCRTRTIVARVERDLRRRRHALPKVAVGLAVPQIEAWYLAGRDPRIGEPAWIVGQQSGKPPYAKNSLKQKVYGTDRPSLDLEIQRAVEEAQRIVRDGELPLLSQLFPGGFGALANDVQNW
jgi:hypothetical protein